MIATGRNQARLDSLPGLGADVVISLEQPEAELLQGFRQEIGDGVNVVLDYLWGRSAELLIAAVSGEAHVRFVQIGSISGAAISLPGAALRSSGLELLGSGLGSCSYEELVAAVGEVLKAVIPAGLRIETEILPLASVEAGWTRDTGDRRLVLTPSNNLA